MSNFDFNQSSIGQQAIIENAETVLSMRDLQLRKNLLLFGPPSCDVGRIIIETMRMLGIPVLSIDGTQLRNTSTYFEENAFSRLLQVRGFDDESSHLAVIFIENIDRIIEEGSAEQKLQEELEVILKGCPLDLETKSSRHLSREGTKNIDTSKISFIASTSILNQKEKPIIDVKGQNNRIDQAEICSRLVNKKFRPSFIQSFDEILNYTPVIKEEVRDYLLNRQENMEKIVGGYGDLVEFELNEGAIDFLVDRAIELGTGVHGIRTILKNISIRLSFQNEKMPKTKVSIDENWLDEYLYELVTIRSDIRP